MPTALTQMTPAEIRQEITHSVIRDIHGPAGGEHEELDSRRHGPISRYLVGKLAPVNQKVTPHQSDGLGDRSSDESEDGASDQNALQATTLLPSSIGLSFCMLPGVDSLAVRVNFGTYERIISDVLTDEKSGTPVKIWQRTPHDATIELSFEEGSSDALHFYDQIPELYLKYHVRTVRDKATKVVSLFLVNGQREEDKSTRDEFWLFQPSIEVQAKDGSAIFLERLKQTTQGHLSDSYWNETRSNAMRYRKTGEFAVGHGVCQYR